MRNFSRVHSVFGILVAVVVLFLSAGTASGRSDARIAGTIKTLSGNPLHDAVIRIFREVRSGNALLVARSDSQGYFRSPGLKPGRYYLQISRQGYEPVTTSKFSVSSGSTASLSVILEKFAESISDNDNPQNWSLKTVMRSTADRRVIFRELSDDIDEKRADTPFSRGGAMSIASRAALNSDSYQSRSMTSQSGVSSSFAFSEPLNQHSRMVVSGQLDYGAGSFWRLRNTYNYRPDRDHDYRLSVGYGEMTTNYRAMPGASSSLASSPDSDLMRSGVETLALGFEARAKLLDIMSLEYGFDYSHLDYGVERRFFYPSIQLVVHPAKGWNVRSSFTSQRVSDASTVVLPDGELLNLAEPTLITMVGDEVRMSQVTHAEVAAERMLDENTAVEVAVYQDRTRGPGLPLMVTTVAPGERRSQVVELSEDNSGQRGLRVSVKRQLGSSFRGSIIYAYGDAVDIADPNRVMGAGTLESGVLTDYLRRRNQHSVTGRLDAVLPLTGTRVLTTVRWYSGNPVTPVDWFSDSMDIATKSTNFEIRQCIPMWGSAGRWEVVLDLRNVMNQGRGVLPTSDGEIVLNRNPRSLRFGLSIGF